jgi:hypothetical protein
VFKRLFGKTEDELGLGVNRFAEPDLKLPSKKPPPDVTDLVLPEPLAEEATHPREVDLNFVITSRKGDPAPAGATAAAELTDAQIETIAQRVADKLAAGVVGDRLRETVARIVSETSEQLVREEIARIRAEAAPE